MLPERLTRFVQDPTADDFSALVRAAFAFQVERSLPLAGLAARRGVTPDSLRDYRDVPLVPATAFQRFRLATAPEQEVFRSSGTTGGPRAVHYHPFPDLYRATIDAAFPAFCLPGGAPPVMLALCPTREQVPDSSLGFMLDHVLRQWGAPGSTHAFGARGVDLAVARSWLAARQRDHRPALLLATGFALADLLGFLERMELRLRLPAGSAVFLTGGTKGRTRELAPEELERLLAEHLGLTPERVVGEYGMTELTSQFYTRALTGGAPGIFVGTPWLRFRLLDPETLAEVPAGSPGLLAIFDLANIGSALHLLTADLGVAAGEGFRLLGRAPGAEPRGCSLLVEELGAPPV